MAQHSDQLDGVFHALSDPTRRAVLTRLGRGPASVSELAEPFDMALPSFMKHVRLLEQGGWITSKKIGRVRTCTLEKRPFSTAEQWIARQQASWEAHTDRLEKFLSQQETPT
nr:helix-turn-helix transcriptional regulator [Rhodococcus sp. (in: high G+C Gram-positive bacteria)]